MENIGANTETQLGRLHIKLGENGKFLADLLNRVKVIGNRLVDDSANLEESNPELKNEKMFPGIITSLHEDADGINRLLGQLDKQVTKISQQC